MPLHDGRPPCALWPAAGRAAASSSFVTAPGRAREQGGNEQRGVAFCCASTSENLKLSAAAVVSPRGGRRHPPPLSPVWLGGLITHSHSAVAPCAHGQGHGWCGRPCTRPLWTRAAWPGFCRTSSRGNFWVIGMPRSKFASVFFSVRVFLEFPLDLQRKHMGASTVLCSCSMCKLNNVFHTNEGLPSCTVSLLRRINCIPFWSPEEPLECEQCLNTL